MTGWIDYIIASDDSVDKALLDEFCDQARAYGQVMQHLTADPANINAEDNAMLENGQARQTELQDRIRARGEALRAAGYSPCDEETFNS